MMARTPRPIRSDIAWSNRKRIVVRGKDLPTEVIGTLNLGDFSYLQLTGRMPTPQQVGHIMEEAERPIVTELWLRTEEEASAHMRQPDE
jgi:hypothetical protein